MARPSPTIDDLSWGRIVTAAGSFRDARLWPGGGRNWDWTETGTHHDPGIQAGDVTELLDEGAQVVVLGSGQQERLRVSDEVIAACAARGVACEVLPTPQAVERYNTLVQEGSAVGALIHSTC